MDKKYSDRFPHFTNLIKSHAGSMNDLISLAYNNPKAKNEIIEEIFELKSAMISDENIQSRMYVIIRAINEELKNHNPID